MRLNIFLLLISTIIFSLESINAQHVNFEWAISEGSVHYDYGKSIGTDVLGNVYITGLFQETVDFDPSGNTFNLTATGGSFSTFIQKLDANGNFLWAKSIGGTSSVSGYSAIDIFGNVYTTGRYQGVVDFDPSAGTFNLTSSGQSDAFVQKLDADGNFLWAKSMGGSSADEGFSIAVDTFGNIFTAGLYHQTADFDPSGNTLNLVSNGEFDIFIQKLDPSGNFLWAKSVGGPLFDEVSSITTDASGNVYLAGIYSDTADFDPSGAVFSLVSNGEYDIFIEKLDANGNFLWAKSVGGTETEYATSIATDTFENVYLTGCYPSVVDFDPSNGIFNLTSNGSNDLFIQKLDANGNFKWAKSIGGAGSEKGYSIATDFSSGVYIAGLYEGTTDFDPSSGVFNLISNGSADIFIQKLDTNGNLKWTKSIGAEWGDQAEAIAIDTFGNVYTTGFHVGKTDFDPSSDTLYLNPTTLQGNIFIQKLSQDAPNTGTDMQATCDTFYVWVDGNTYTSSNNSATFNIVGGAANGSDSLITLDLTMTVVDTNVIVSSNNITASATNATFRWLDCEDNYAPIAGYFNPVFIPANTSLYAVEVTQNGCTDTSACFLFVVDGINEMTSLSDIIIYPNPNNGRFSIDLDRPYDDVTLSIVDIYGKTIFASCHQQTQSIELEITQAPGIYFAYISTGNRATTLKLIKK